MYSLNLAGSSKGVFQRLYFRRKKPTPGRSSKSDELLFGGDEVETFSDVVCDAGESAGAVVPPTELADQDLHFNKTHFSGRNEDLAMVLRIILVFLTFES